MGRALPSLAAAASLLALWSAPRVLDAFWPPSGLCPHLLRPRVFPKTRQPVRCARGRRMRVLVSVFVCARVCVLVCV